MSHLRSIRIALIAAIAIAALAATAASALENPEILPNPTPAAPVTFSGSGGMGSFTSSAGVITSVSTRYSGEFTSTRLGVASLEFLQIVSQGVKCKSLGDENGTVLATNTDAHLVDILPAGTLALGIAIKLSSTLLVKCGTLLVEIKGTLIGVVDGVTSGASIPVGVVKTLLFAATKLGGITQAIKSCDLDKTYCSGRTYLLEAEFGTGFKEAAEETSLGISFNKAISIDF